MWRWKPKSFFDGGQNEKNAGGNDARINTTIPKSQELMKAANKSYDPVTYEGAGHGFMRAGEDPADTNQANKKARDQAWVRVKEILKKL